MPARIGAGSYLLGLTSTVNAWCLAMILLLHKLIEPGLVDHRLAPWIVGILGLPVGGIYLGLSAGRFRDLNASGLWAVAVMIPIIGLLLTPLLCFCPGPRYRNDYGDPPEPSGWLKLAAGILSLACMLVLLLYVTRIYAPLHLAEVF